MAKTFFKQSQPTSRQKLAVLPYRTLLLLIRSSWS
jgi:hypothetical protein